jgi:hypothetical protein
VSTCDGQWQGHFLAAVGLAAQGRLGKQLLCKATHRLLTTITLTGRQDS